MSLGEQRRRPVGRLDTAVRNAVDRWIEFWFTPSDPAPLCVIRLLIGGMLVYSHFVWGLDLPAFLGSEGWNSAEVVRELQRDQWNRSFWWMIPDSLMQTAHQWCLGILILFWLGCFTRITSVLALIIHISYSQRAAVATYGLDQICGILLLYLVLAPCGADYSVDSFWRRYRRSSGTGLSTGEFVGDRSVAANLSMRLIQVHYCIIYFFAATGKLQGETWWTGDALWNAIANYEYQSTDLTWLAWYPEVLQVATHVTIFWELSFAYLIWVRPLRPLLLGLGVLMHLGIGAFLGMWPFGLAMIFGYVAFIDPATVRAIMRFPFAGRRPIDSVSLT